MKRGLLIGIGILLLLAGCSGKQEDVADQNIDDVVSEAEVSENEVSDNEVFENEISDPEPTVYLIETKNIVNIEEAFAGFWSNSYDAPRDITLERNYIDEVPVELQDLLIYYGDIVRDEYDEYWAEYGIGYDDLKVDNTDIPAEIDCDYDIDGAIDFDGDGEVEYFRFVPNGTGWMSYITFYKNVEGVWVDIPVGNSSIGKRILCYEDRYYLIIGDSLIWWNHEAETDLSYWEHSRAAVIGGDICWNTLVLDMEITGYTPYEVYSNAQYDFSDDMENINWETLEDNRDGKVDIDWRSDWHTDSGSFNVEYGWERIYEGEQYLYVIAEDYHQRSPIRADDKALTILHRAEDGTWEIVKVYYLAANYYEKFKFNEPEYY